MDDRETNDTRVWIQELIAHSAMEQMRVMQRFNEVLKRVARGDMNPQAVHEEITRFAQDEATHYIGDLTRLSLSFYSALLDLSRDYNDRLLKQLTGPPPNHNANHEAHAAAPAQIEMPLQGVVGEDVVKTFVIESKRAEPVEVSFLVSEFIDADNTHTFRPPLQLQPSRFTLRPGEERAVTLRLPLLAGLFAPGQRYRATVVVRGYDDLELLLEVQTHEAPAAAVRSADAARAPAPRRPRAADDLTRLKGVGPQFAAKLAQAGIATFAELAATDEQTLAEVLGASALAQAQRYGWLEQARLAANGDMKGRRDDA
ncbi:MAG: helix-hairpin-helix domain-containing protein [Anaerolineae bacterium]|nr:helix-hairpin-helix domain-containing protein [Anaerolineae bacterium]